MNPRWQHPPKMNRYEKNGCRRSVVVIELAEAFLAELAAQGFRPRSLSVFGLGLQRLAAFLTQRGKARVQDLTPEDLEAYRLALSSQPLAPATRCLYLRTVRKFCAWLESTRRIFLNPAAGLVVGRVDRRLQPVPTEEEMVRLLAQPDTTTDGGLRDRALLETAYSTGLRRAELIGLSVSDVNLEHETLQITGKGGRERVVPLGGTARHWLSRYLAQARPRLVANEPIAALWVTPRAQPLSYQALIPMLRRYARRAGIATPITPHSLRRACATHLLGHGAHPAHLQLLLGHAGLRHLGQYLQLSITELRATHARSRPGQ